MLVEIDIETAKALHDILHEYGEEISSDWRVQELIDELTKVIGEHEPTTGS